MRSIELDTRRRLDAARLFAGGAVAIFGQFAINAPASYFGPADQMTLPGAGFVALVSALLILGIVIRVSGRNGYRVLGGTQHGLVVAAFIPLAASDPIVGGAVVGWHLYLFVQLVFSDLPIRKRGPRSWIDRTRPAPDRNAPAARHLLSVSVGIAIAALGFRVGDRVPTQVISGLAGLAGLAVAVPFILRRLRAGSVGVFVFAVLLVAAAGFAGELPIALSLFAAAQAWVLGLLWVHTSLFDDLLDSFYRRPAYLVVLSFAGLIAIGTLFLSFPAASASESPIHPLDAMFTATSAACVTGLIVLDTPHAFSPFGHGVLLALMQFGGLNIMVLSAFAAGILGRSLGMRGEGALRDVLDLQPGRSVRRLVLFVGLATLAVEAIGTAVLTGRYMSHGYDLAPAIWYGAFHAVSAFCNAGFSLHSDSLVGFANDPGVLIVMASLITAGGLGFGVLGYLWSRALGRRRPADATHARIVLIVSAVLLVGGSVAYAIAEWNHTLRGLEPTDRLVNAVFQSVTLRTAGFNSVVFDEIRPATLSMMLVWMFVGASPGGTGGGIKTTTAAVLVGSVLAVLARRERIVLARRRMSLDTVFRSAAIATVAAVVVALGTFSLLATQSQRFEVLVFEAFSAFGTVGLSLGATASLDSTGKIVVIVLMLIGRVGPLTLALLVGRSAASHVRYPDSRIMVG